MIAKITPLIRLPSSTDTFDYHVPDEFKNKIKQGQLVTIPWRTKKLPGVVLDLGGESVNKKFRARPITGILDEQPILTPNQLKLIGQFAQYYFVTRGSVARLITPDKPKRDIKLKTHPLTSSDPHNTFILSKSQLPKLQQTVSQLAGNQNHIQINDISSFVWLILHLTKKSNSQILVLFPTIDLIKSVETVVHKMCSGNYAVIHSELSKGNYWKQYQKILLDQAKIILSTRQGAFLPIQSNAQIIFFESTSQDFKQYDQHPRYDARIVAGWLSDITESQLILTSSHSQILTTQSKHNISLRELPSGSSTMTTVKLTDMKNEMHKRDFSIIADTTLSAIKKTTQKNKKILILSLRYEAEEGVSVNKIHEILTNTLKNCKVAKTEPKKDLEKNFDVLVATPYSLETLKLISKRREFELAVFASIEPLLALADFRSAQRSFNRLNYWKMLCQELQIPQIILQSYSPDNLAIRAFAYGEVDAFIKSELANRKQLNYPPFGQLIKLTYKHEVPYELDRAIKFLKDNLESSVQILGPFKDKKSQESLLLKVTQPSTLTPLLSLPHGWAIDRDPENVL
jgi:primosomal protein N'